VHDQAMSLSEAVGAGVAAGLAVAVPLGAIGALVLGLGLRHGSRAALAAGLGVATVDGLYAVLAAVAGAALAAPLARAEDTIRLVAAAVLGAVAVVLLRGALAPAGEGGDRHAERRGGAAAPRERAGGGGPAPRRLYGRFVALTAVNPLTAATFAAVAAGLPAAGAGRIGVAAAAGFGAGAFAASAAWHAVLAGTSGAAGRRLPPAARAWTAVAGAGLALLLAARLALAG
jgi:threonine/homoserine/homoserine lactone efflux protein